jgi:putative tricarboxylic transport membrane protein
MKKFLMLAALAFVIAVVPGISRAEEYPSKPITLVVPFPAGGRTDTVGRIVAQYLHTALGQPISVINKPGASSVLGSNYVAESGADGYTLGFFSTSAVTAQYTVPTPLDLSKFELIAIVNADPAALAVNGNAKWKTLKELVAYAKSKPDTLKMGMIPGASAQIFAAGFEKAAGIKMIDVPFKGDAPGAVALAGGHIDVHIAVPVAYKSLVAAKKVRILAVAAEERSPLYGNLPTFKENGVDFVINAFHGVYVPKGTPAAVKSKIAKALEVTMKNPELKSRMASVGAAVVYRKGPAALAYLNKQDETYRTIIDQLGLRAKKAM